ncbi:XRE family transcriptional regulator [Bradyrhizobium elkanii]|uniref:XRE family transcriptional regulator n=1 Tax=Bradyrhizobium elkanii TaxID=29448 RepID=UPI001BAA6E7A|nr:XRE family transcriptional regulator [Bradyrhizobium elkanii]MBR1165024.1 ImmA/IrrE family metallo-endopeptidase [Bradyrhizobium elkanii]
MAKSVKALINPAMLAWARKQAGFSPDEAARRLHLDERRLGALENGEETPTFAKLLDIAELYKRPVSLFYLKTPPKGWQPIQDFRRLPGVDDGFSPQLTFAIRQARERREIALTVRDELGQEVQPFDLKATLKSDVEKLGQQIRNYLGVTEAKQQRFGRKAFDGWRLAIEAKDVLVFVVPRLKIREMRGTALAEQKMPVILVNGKDRGNGRVFTLLHEFCHLALRQSGVSNLGGDRNDAPHPEVEKFCNAVAAAALMPLDWLLSESLVAQKGSQKSWHDGELEALALRFGVSQEAVLRRLLTLGRTSQAFYDSKRADFQKIYAQLDEQKEPSDGGPKYHYVVLSQLGRTFTQLIFQGYHDRYFTLRDVAGLLNMKVTTVPVMEKAAFGMAA